MGWCHEFGPQIVETCEHPMVAGGSTCTCAQCGAICRGRFAGCVDVWARGPRSVTVRVRPTEEPLRRHRGAPVADVPQAVEPLRIEAAAIDVHTNGSGGGDQATIVMLDHLWEKLRDLESTVAAKQEEPAPSLSNARLEAISNAVGGIAGGLDRLSQEVRGLQRLPARLEALEAEVKRKQQGAAPYDQTLPETVTRLATKIRHVEEVQGRVEALERALDKVESGTGGAEVARQLQELSAKVAAVDKLGNRVTGLEQAKRTSTDRDLTTMAGRVTALERAEAGSSERAPDAGKALDQLERLSNRVAALEALDGAVKKVPDGPAPVQPDRLAGMEKVVGGLVQTLERVSSQVAALDDLPKRLAALEEAKAPPAEKVLTSISKRLDRLSTQVSALKDLPVRVEAAEHGAARAETLGRGLRGAIDMIDQLSAQVSALQDARPTAAATRPGATSPGAPPPSPPSPPAGPPPPTPPPAPNPTPAPPTRPHPG